MWIATTRFGLIQFEPEDVIRFPEGILGLPGCRQWLLLADRRNPIIAWLQSVDRPEVALCVVSPRRFVPNYQVRLPRRDLEPLELENLESAEVLVIVSRSAGYITLNLKAPLIFNLQRGLARQVVCYGDQPIQYVVASLNTALRKTA